VLTGGGPGNATLMYNLFLYREAFQSWRLKPQPGCAAPVCCILVISMSRSGCCGPSVLLRGDERRERICRAFAHQEGDRVPVFELDVDSPVTSAICGGPCGRAWMAYVNGSCQRDVCRPCRRYYQRKIEG